MVFSHIGGREVSLTLHTRHIKLCLLQRIKDVISLGQICEEGLQLLHIFVVLWGCFSNFKVHVDTVQDDCCCGKEDDRTQILWPSIYDHGNTPNPPTKWSQYRGDCMQTQGYVLSKTSQIQTKMQAGKWGNSRKKA